MPRLTNQLLRSRAQGPLSTLEYLDLSNLQIDVIERVSQCTKLQTLILRGNKICFVSNLDQCTNLWHLDLGSNQIQSLHGLRRFLAFGTLILSDNDIGWCELSEIRSIHILNLSLHGNPQLERDPYYRIHVVDSLPNVWALDGRIVTSAERIQVKQFFQESALSDHPVRHKLCQDTYFAPQPKEIAKSGIFGNRAIHMITSFPVNAISNIDMDRKKLKYLAYNLQNDLALQRKYTKCEMMVLEQSRNFLELILEGRAADRERCNMLLVLLVGSLQFVLPTHLVKETLETAKLTKFNDVYSMAIFLLPREVRCRVVSVLLGAVKIDKDVKEYGGLYDKLYLCLFHTISELTRISQSCDVTGAARNSKQKALFRDNKVLLASEIVQLMCLVPVFYEYITKDSGVGNLVITATGDRTILDIIRTIFDSSNEKGEDLQKCCEAIYSLLVREVEANLLEMNFRKPKISPGELILLESKALPMKTYKTPIFSSSFHYKGLSSPDLDSPTVLSKKLLIGPPQPFPHLGDVVLLGPQTVGKVISLPQPFLGLVGMDAIPMTNGAMEYRLRDLDSHYSYVDMTRLEWDPVYCLWKPIGSVGDSEMPESQKKRYTIDTAEAMQLELERRAQAYHEAPRPNSPVSGVKNSHRGTHSASYSGGSRPLIYTSRAQTADMGNKVLGPRDIQHPGLPDFGFKYPTGSKQVWPPRASSFQHKQADMPPRPMSSVLKEKLNLQLSMPGRPMSAVPNLQNGPPPTPTTAQSEAWSVLGQESIRKSLESEQVRESIDLCPEYSVSNSVDASPRQSLVKRDPSQGPEETDLTTELNTELHTELNSDVNTAEPNIELNTEVNTDVNTEANADLYAKPSTEVNIVLTEPDFELNTEQNTELNTELKTELNTELNSELNGEFNDNANNNNALESQDDRLSTGQTIGTTRATDGSASEKGDAGGIKNINTSQNQNGNTSSNQVGDPDNSRQPLAGDAGSEKNGQPATKVEHHNQENDATQGDQTKENRMERTSEFLQQYGKKGNNSQITTPRKALHMAQIGTRVSIQMPSIHDGASEDQSSRLDEESSRKWPHGGGPPLVPATKPPHLGPRNTAGRPTSAARRGRPCSAVEGNRYIASPRVNVRPDSASAYQRLRVEAWKSNRNAPNIVNGASNPETAVVPYLRRSKSADHKQQQQGQVSSHILKLKRGNDWLAGGRDLHWEMMRQRPRSSHVPGWKEGLPPSMKRRPRSAAAPQTRLTCICRKPKPTYAPSEATTSEAVIIPGRPPTPELPHLHDTSPLASGPRYRPRPGSPTDWGDLVYDPQVPELVYRSLRQPKPSPCLQCIYESALEWYGLPSTRSNTTHASKTE